MPLRVLLIAAVLLIAGGCASTSATPRLSRAQYLEANARADSLLALPPAALSQTDAAWLAAYAARRSHPSAHGRIVTQAVATTFVLSAMLSAVAYFVLQDRN